MASFFSLRRLAARVRALWVLFSFLLVLPHAVAAPQDVTFRATATDEGFSFIGFEGVNPRLPIEPGQKVLVALYNGGSKSVNFQVGAPIHASSPCCLVPGDSDSVEFVVPEDLSGEVAYYSSTAPDVARGVFVVGEPVPAIRVEAPSSGTEVGASITMRVVVTNFELDPYPLSEQNQEGRGHVRYLVDGNVTAGPTNRTSNTFFLTEVGTHLLRAELVNHDGSRLIPAVSAQILVYRVRDAMTDPEPPPTPETPKSTPFPLALALASAVIASAFLRRR